MPIYISEDAFITLTLSAIETSTKFEATGLLLGHKSGDTYYVQNAIPYQLAERTANSICVSPSKQQRIRRVFKNYLKYKIIGEFHTHPDGSIKLSNADKKVIRNSDYDLEIVVAINQEKSDSPWHYEQYVLSGSIDKYYLEIGCWRVIDKKTTKLSIRCPFAVGFDFVNPLI